MIAMAAAMSIYATPPAAMREGRRRGSGRTRPSPLLLRRPSPLLYRQPPSLQPSPLLRPRRFVRSPSPSATTVAQAQRSLIRSHPSGQLWLSPAGPPASVALSWRLDCPDSPLDWLGLFLQQEKNPFKYLAYKSRSQCSDGEADWALGAGLFRGRLADGPLAIVFRYFSATTGAVVAESEPLSVALQPPNTSTAVSRTDEPSHPESLVVTGLRASQMKASSHILPCHYQAKFRLGGQTRKAEGEARRAAWRDLSLALQWEEAPEGLEVWVRERGPAGLGGRTVAWGRVPLSALRQAWQASGQDTEGRAGQLVAVPGLARLRLSLRFPPQEKATGRAALAEEESGQIEAQTPRADLPPPLPMDTSADGSEDSPDQPLDPPPDHPPPPPPKSEKSDSGISQCSLASPPRPDSPSLPGLPSTSRTALSPDQGRPQAFILRNPHARGSSVTSAGASSSASAVPPLPAQWEARVDRHGRVFYVDHASKRTTWDAPATAQLSGPSPASPPAQSANSLRRQLIEKRYSQLRRSVASSASASSQPLLYYVRTFLQRPDFVSFLHSNERALELYNASAGLTHILSRVRKDPSKLERFLSNSDLVAFLNCFADESAALPSGWERRTEAGSGATLFVDHVRRTTTLVDPRLPLPSGQGRGQGRANRSASQRRPRPRSVPGDALLGGCQGYQDHVVRFLRRPELLDLLQQRLPTLASEPKLRRKLAYIARTGTPALQRYANDVDLITLLSCFDEEIRPASVGAAAQRRPSLSSEPSPSAPLSFDAKLAAFYERLETKGYGQGPGKLKLHVRRDEIVKDAFEQISQAPKRDLQRNKLAVAFRGEEGLDYGGPSREFFFLLSRELFNPYYGLFEYSANDTYTVQISPMSVFVDDYLAWFQFCGRVLGLGLIHRYLIDAFFTRPFYKGLLKAPWAVSDLESLDAEFHASLVWLEENGAEGLELRFAVTEEVGGAVVERELVEGGAAVPVTEANKADYVQRILRWRLERGVRKQASALLRGFYEVVDPLLLGVFDAGELELVLSGAVEIDVEDWRRHTEYRGGYAAGHVVVRWFWEAVERLSNAQRLLLLQFVTGTSSVPHEGFAALRGSHGPKRFALEKWGTTDSLPRAHTCFNRLDLPPYPSPSILYRKLLLAIEESASYAIE